MIPERTLSACLCGNLGGNREDVDSVCAILWVIPERTALLACLRYCFDIREDVMWYCV